MTTLVFCTFVRNCPTLPLTLFLPPMHFPVKHLPLFFAFPLLGWLAGCNGSGQTTDEQADTLRADTLAAAPVRLEEVWQLTTGLDRPESALYDSERDVIYVSNIEGDPSAADGQGYLMVVATDGTVVDSAWVTGLDAPKGMARFGSKLYVADLDDLVEIDLPLGTVLKRYPGQGAEFLNDVTVDDAGNVYVSDSRNSAIYRLAQGTFDRWLDDGRVRSPNGLYVQDGALVVAAGDSTADNPGNARYLMRVSLDGTQITPLHGRTPLGGIDAVEPDADGGYFLSDWGAAKVMYLDRDGRVSDLVSLTQGTADLDYVAEKEMIYLPVMMSNRLVAYRVVR